MKSTQVNIFLLCQTNTPIVNETKIIHSIPIQITDRNIIFTDSIKTGLYFQNIPGGRNRLPSAQIKSSFYWLNNNYSNDINMFIFYFCLGGIKSVSLSHA